LLSILIYHGSSAYCRPGDDLHSLSVSRSFELMRKQYRLALLVLTTLAVVPMLAHGQAGGGTLSREPAGGAAMIFRKPENPPVHGASGPSAVGGDRSSARTRTRSKPTVNVQEQTIAKANAARSAATPRYSEAELNYKLAARQDPNDARAQLGLGNVYLDQGRFQDAVAAYQQALKVKPDYSDAYQPLSYALAQLGRFPEAADTLKQALAFDPDNAEIYNNLAFAYAHAERYPEAIDASQHAITLLGQTGGAYRQGLQNRNEVLSNAYKNLGNSYNELKHYSEAAEALKKAAEIEPTNAAAHFNLGLALYNGKRYSEAIEAYKAVVKLRPQLAAAHYNLGLTFVAINDQASARQELEILKPLNAQMASALSGLIKR
jgi:tetratricopeptide (TPR) repeat protein